MRSIGYIRPIPEGGEVPSPDQLHQWEDPEGEPSHVRGWRNRNVVCRRTTSVDPWVPRSVRREYCGVPRNTLGACLGVLTALLLNSLLITNPYHRIQSIASDALGRSVRAQMTWETSLSSNIFQNCHTNYGGSYVRLDGNWVGVSRELFQSFSREDLEGRDAEDFIREEISRQGNGGGPIRPEDELGLISVQRTCRPTLCGRITNKITSFAEKVSNVFSWAIGKAHRE